MVKYVNIFVMCDINVFFMNRYAAEKSRFRHRRKHPFASMKKWQGTFLILNNSGEEGENRTKPQFLNPDILAS